MFDPEQFISDCKEALAQDASHKAVKEVVERAISDPASVFRGLGEPNSGGIQKIYHSEDLTIVNVVWAPGMTVMPHNHRMWALIGVYAGREDNIFWRRIPNHQNGLVEAAGASSLGKGEVTPLGKDIIHSVTNPLMKLTGAIHVYGGDFFAVERSEWDPECLLERPYDVEKNMALFTDVSTL